MSEILCSTGALIGRPNSRNYQLLRNLSSLLQCDGFEFMMYDSWYGETDAILDLVQDLKLHIPVMHCEKSIGEKISAGGTENIEQAFEMFDINCKMAEALGSEKLVIHLWNGLISDKNFQNNIAAYPQLAECAKAYGLDLLVENVVCNTGDPMTHFCELRRKYPDIHFVFDTKMAAFHSQMELICSNDYAWLWRNGHIRHYHVNDYGGDHMDWNKLQTLPIGAGNIDFDRFFDFIRMTGYSDTFTIESTAFNSDGIIDVSLLNRQIHLLRRLLQ